MYSQNEEEKYILEHVGNSGVFLDIGAFDGKTFSNTLALAERGWAGVLVEPSMYGLKALQERHGKNQKLKVLQALVGTERGIAHFWPSPDAVSTTMESHYLRWKGATHFDDPYFLPRVTIAELIIYFPMLSTADVVSVDTEGTSVEIFCTFPFYAYHPKVFCVEYDSDLGYLSKFADSKGYRCVYESGENVVLVHD